MSDEDIVVAAIVEGRVLHGRAVLRVLLDRAGVDRPPRAGRLVPDLRRGRQRMALQQRRLAARARMRDIEREFEAAPELAALVADMLEEIDALRARLRSWKNRGGPYFSGSAK
jgi:chaperone modulatory protein CbpM